MDCTSWVDEMTAIAVGADASIEPALLDSHVRQCPDCREYRRTLEGRGPITAMGPGTLAASVRRAAVREDQSRHDTILRYALVLFGLQIIVLAAPALLFVDTTSTTPHDARHLGAFATAYGVGLLLVARRPARARTMLGVGQVLVAALALSAIIDVIDRTVSLTTEFLHLPEVLALVVLWMMSRDNASANLESSPVGA
ncbi:MAG: hypothetical protein R2707_05455 [Acidimicrobiales bacterium]